MKRFQTIYIKQGLFLAERLNEIIEPGWLVIQIKDGVDYIHVLVDTNPPGSSNHTPNP